MNMVKCLLCAVATGLLTPQHVWAADDAGAATLLERLKANDSAFDNAILRYVRSGEYETAGLVSWKDPPGWAEQHGIKDPGPQLIKFRFYEQMVVRSDETTFTREPRRV